MKEKSHSVNANSKANPPSTYIENQLLGLSASEGIIELTELIEQISNAEETFIEKFNHLMALNQVVSESINQKLNQYDFSHHSSQSAQVKHSQVLIMAGALANAYVELVKEMLENPNTSSVLLIDCIYFAAYFTSKKIVYCFYFLQAIPEGTWKSMHYLYRISDDKGIANITPSATLELNCNLNTIELIYKNLLIISTLDPYGFRVNVLHKIFFLSKLYASLLIISKSKANYGIVYQIEINDNFDRSPVKTTESSKESTDNYFLDFTKIIQRMDALLLTIKECNKVNTKYTEVEINLPLDMLEKFSKNWKTSYVRQLERIQCNEKVLVFFGLPNITQAIKMSSNEINNYINSTDQGKHLERKGNQKHFSYNGLIENASEFGYMISFRDAELITSYIGELIIIVKSIGDSKYSFETAVVRWAYQTSSEISSIGVEVIMREPSAAIAKYESVNSQAEYPTLINDNSIIVFNEIFIRGQVIKICDIVDEFKVQLGNNKMISAIYTQFPYTRYQ